MPSQLTLTPRFAAEPIIASTLRAVLAMHWRVSEKVVESLVGFNVSHTLPPGQVVPLNPAARQLLEELGLSSLVIERRSAVRS